MNKGVIVSRKRIITLFLVLAVVIAAATGSWIAGSNIHSPAEMAARTAPPTPSPILVPVEQRVLSSEVVTRGTARFGLPQAISIVPSALKPRAGLITTLPLRNTQLKEGDVTLTVSGRPVFVLVGEVPAYRDLVPGISGNDVRQLEHALKRLGFDPGPIGGTFDHQTSAAVGHWYTSAGWQPFGPTAEQLAAIRALEQELAVAINNKSAAEDRAAAAPRAIDAARANADHANKVADAGVVAKILARQRLGLDPRSTQGDRAIADAELELARAAVKSAQLQGHVAVQAALDAQKVAEREAKRADRAAVRLAADLEGAKSKAGVQVPVDEIVFIPNVPVRVEQIDLVVGDVARGPVLMVTNNQLAIDASLRLDEAPLVKPGMAVAIDEQALGINRQL